jgi:DNA-directed RNA polymerase subunit RPC12/RpoP
MKENSKLLSVMRPKLCKEWDHEENYPLKPNDVNFDSHKKVYWKCSKHHKWKMRIIRRSVKHENCPRCKRLSYVFLRQSKRIMSEWDCVKNVGIDPNKIKMASNKMFSWKCNKCGNSWYAQPNNRKNGTDCPYCSGNKVSSKNSLVKNYPKLIKEWDYSKNKNVDINTISFGSGKRVHWICSKCQGSWISSVLHRTKSKSGCPYCSGDKVWYKNCFANNYKQLLKEWDFDRNKIDPYKITYGAKNKAYWICKNNHKWKALVINRVNGFGCPHCSKIILKDGTKCDSKTEAYFYLTFKKQYPNLKCHGRYPEHNGKNIGKRKYDFYIPFLNKYVEVTSYLKNDYLSYKAYKNYIENINVKRNYVEGVLGARFEFIQRKLEKKERLFVNKYVAKIV